VRDLEAQRDEDGSYFVWKPTPSREPVDWTAVVWVALGIVGIAISFVGTFRWLTGW